MLEHLDAEAKRALVRANEVARALGDEVIDALHLFAAAASDHGPTGHVLVELELTEVAFVGNVPDAPPPDPMSRKEAKRVRDELRARGIGLAKAEALVERLQRQRSTGPLTLHSGLRELVSRLTEGGRTVGLAEVLAATCASPPAPLARVLSRAGLTGAELAEALRR